MASLYLDQPFDIHGGGSDLVFPHHENEIAQSEAAEGKPFANLWVHNGMITFGADKMSKSLGNVIGIRDALAHAPGEALRLMFLGTHYRAPLDFSLARLDETQRALVRLYEALARADDGKPTPAVPVAGALAGTLSPFLESFVAAMDDDLNAARAMGLVFDRLRDLNRALDAGDRTEASAIRAELARVAAATGVMSEDPGRFLEGLRTRGQERTGLSTEEIEAAIAERNAARGRKDFRAADAIRARLAAQGILLEDTPSGTLWKAG
jgi:cysteinyl-tRNA synthetase